MPNEASSSSDTCNFQQSPEQEVYTVLFDACRTGDLQTLKMLLEKDCTSVNQKYEGQTLLILAIKEKQHEIVKFLLEHEDIDPNEMDDDWEYTPLLHSSTVGDLQIFDWLLNHKKIDVVKKGSCDSIALHHASLDGQKEMVQKLLTIDPTLVNFIDTHEHQPPLYYACTTGRIEIVEILLQYQGSQLNCLNEAMREAFDELNIFIEDVSTIQDYSPEQKVYINSFINHIEEHFGRFSLDVIITSLLKVIFRQGCDSHIDLQLIFHLACVYETPEAVKFCLEQKEIDINRIAQEPIYLGSIKGETPLTSACRAVKDNYFIDFLLSFSTIDINKKDGHGKSPLFRACNACIYYDDKDKTNHLQVVLRLLKAPEISVTEDIIDFLLSKLEADDEKIQNNAKKILSALLIKNFIPESKVSQIEALELYENWQQFKNEHFDNVSNLQQVCFQAIQKHQISKPHFFPKIVLEENKDYLEKVLNHFLEWGGLKSTSNAQVFQAG